MGARPSGGDGSAPHVVHAWHLHVGEGVVAELPKGAGPALMPPPTPSLLAAEREEEQETLEAAKQQADAMRAEHERQARGVVEAALAKVTEGDPVPVDVEAEVIEGHPGEVLVEAARDADLLVVGCRGRGELLEAVLGSVSRHCVHYAPCPVVVVPRDVRARSLPRASDRAKAAAAG